MHNTLSVETGADNPARRKYGICRRDNSVITMKIVFEGGKISGRIAPPPSKSHTHRAFFLSAMAKGRSTVKGALISDDTESTLKACKSIGASIIHDVGSVVIDGGVLHAPINEVDAGNSGTTMRTFAGICSLFSKECRITGDLTLLQRPMGPLLDALGQMGVECGSNDGYPPVTIKGPNLGGKVSVNGGKSSQYATSIIMCAPLIQNDTFLTVTGKMISEPYIDITMDMMRQFGAEVEKSSNTFRIHGGTGYKPCDYIVPGDPSSAAFGMVAGALGGRITVSGLDPEEKGDAGIVSILEKAGAKVTRKDGEVIVESTGYVKPMEIDVGNVPDLFPILAVLLSTAEGDSRLYGAPQLKFKESDRLKSTVDMLNAIGADATATDDGCTIRGKKKLVGGVIDAKGDHRILMAAGVASLVCEGPVIFEGAECCTVSYPSFLTDMERIGLKIITSDKVDL